MLRSFVALMVHGRLAAVAMTLVVAAYGIFAYRATAIEAYPDVTNVQVSVITLAAGLAPEEVERQITLPLERSLNGTPGMISLRSESYFGLSLVTLRFDDDSTSFNSRLQVAQRLQQVNLPDGASPEMAPDNTPLGKIYYYRLNSDRHDLHQLRAEQEWTVTRVLKQVQGVADIVSIGGFAKEFHVEVDPAKLIAHGLRLEDAVQAIEASNRNVGGGMLQRGEQSLLIRGIGLLQTPKDLENIVLKTQGATPVTVKDVARVVQSHTPRQGSVGMDDSDDVVLGIVLLRRDDNPSRVLDQIHVKVAELNKTLPAGMRIEPIYDRSELIGNTLATVHHNLLFGAALIIGILWLFLRSLRGSLIVAVVIPLSLLVAFIGMHWMGMPANLISMGAIDFGIIVDGAVVVTEAIIHRARARQPKTRHELYEVVIDATRFVAKPTLFAMTILIAALIPVFSLEGIEGRIFHPVAFTYSFALIGALIFALTLVPALCALLLKSGDIEAKEPVLFERLVDRYTKFLASLLTQFKRLRLTLVLAVTALTIGGFSAAFLGTEFMPELDEGDAYVLVQMPQSISLDTGRQVLRELRRRLGAFPEVQAVVTEQGRPESGTDNEPIFVSKTLIRLKQRDEWRPGWDKKRLVAEMRAAVDDIPGVNFNFAQPIRDSVEEASSGARGHVVLKIMGPEIEVMRGLLHKTKEALKDVPGIVDLDLYLDSPAPQLHIDFKRDALARHGILMEDVTTLVETALAGKTVTTIWEGERPVPVRVRLPYTERMDEERIQEMIVATPNGSHVPLRSLAEVRIRIGNATIYRESNSRYMSLKFNVEGRDMGSVVKEAMDIFDKTIQLPEGYASSWGGAWENQQRAATRLQIVIPLSLAIVFVLLYAALGSARSAGVVMLTAPFVMIGGVFALHLTGVVLSISAAIGFIALIGQTALVGLLVLSAVESLRREGASMTQALIEGTGQQVRPVLMVTLLGLFGLLPMAISTGVGSEIQRPFATVIVGGMALLPLAALLLLPLIYAVLGPRQMLTASERDDRDSEEVQHA